MRSLRLFALFIFEKFTAVCASRACDRGRVGSRTRAHTDHRASKIAMQNCKIERLPPPPNRQRATAQAASPAQLHGIQQRERPALDEADAEVPGYAQQQ
jgi:hypothetical protein